MYLATASITALIEYGVKPNRSPRLILWLALCNEIFFCETSHDGSHMRFDEASESNFNSQCLTQVLPHSSLLIKDLSEKELAASASTISEAALLWSACFLTVL